MRQRKTLAVALPGWIAAASVLLVPVGASTDEGMARLEVTVRGFRSGDGTLAVALFDNAAHFDARTNPIRKAYLTIADREAHWIVETLPTGDYALLVYHDENGNGELDFRPLGIPKEPVAVSNGATRLLGPPRFDSAKFPLPPATTQLTLQLN
jgi:uncharacterized protein (DUF2141 family)